ncbi:hypothetical protein [Streptomyces sp. NPDC012825]|uniref:hypothetical protein n=1 Tax=Streptomyces sp. NPDC012825 TaxID=3364851 RepID=UPI00369433A7
MLFAVLHEQGGAALEDEGAGSPARPAAGCLDPSRVRLVQTDQAESRDGEDEQHGESGFSPGYR